MIRTRECDRTTQAGRLRKATEFAQAADALAVDHNGEGDSSNAIAPLMVLSGIAAADVICCVKLGRYATGENHSQAVDLVRTAMPNAAKALERLLSVKTKAEYLSASVSKDDLVKTGRAASQLLQLARGLASE